MALLGDKGVVDPRAHVIRVYERSITVNPSSARALAVESDEATGHLGDQQDVVFGGRLENCQLRVLGEKFLIPLIGHHRTAKDRGHGREIANRANRTSIEEHRA